MGQLAFCRWASAAVTRGNTLASAHAGWAPDASGADGADGAREQRTGDAGSSCSGIHCALRIRRGGERCRRLQDVVVEPGRVCHLKRLRLRHVRRKQRRLGIHRRICASESVPRATAIRAQLTLGHVRVLKRLRLQGGSVDVYCLDCTSASAPSAAAACTQLTLDRQLKLGHRPRAPARLPQAPRSSTYAWKPAHTPASSSAGAGASSRPARPSASARTPGDGGERVPKLSVGVDGTTSCAGVGASSRPTQTRA
jgi:hypothetical protein